MGTWFRPLIGRDPYNKKNVDDGIKATNAKLKVMEDHLMINTYLVGERLTLADLFSASIIGRGMQFVLDKEWRDQHPSVTRWFETVTNQSIWTDVLGKAELCEKGLPNPPPQQKKEQKPKQEKQAPQPKKAAAAAKEEDEEEEEDKPAPKPKHPLEALPKPTFVLDDW